MTPEPSAESTNQELWMDMREAAERLQRDRADRESANIRTSGRVVISAKTMLL
jgi:hypothetical protein